MPMMLVSALLLVGGYGCGAQTEAHSQAQAQAEPPVSKDAPPTPPAAAACGQGADADPANAACEVVPQRICVFAFDGVLSSDITAPLEVFGAAQHFFSAAVDTKLLGLSDDPGIVRTAEGLRLAVDGTIDDPKACDAIIVPGAYELEHIAANPRVHRFVQRHMASGARVASNCAGAFVLSAAGALNDRRATTFTGGGIRLAQSNPKIEVVENAKIVVDGPLMTSKGSLVSYGAALLLLSQLQDEAIAQKVFEHLQFAQLGTWQQLTAH